MPGLLTTCRLVLQELVPILAGALIVFGTLEVVLRAFDDFGLNGPGRMGREWIDASRFVNHGKPWFAHEFDPVIELNEEELHAPPLTADPQRPLRIALLGDSYVKGMQLPLEQNFVQLAQRQLEGVQFLPIGIDGQYAPLQMQFFVEELPELFGPEGKYPPVDAVVFCIRLWGGMNIAQGVRDYPVTMPELRWTYPVKAPTVQFLQRILTRPLTMPSHSVSLVSSKMMDWLRADLRNQQNPVDLEAVEFAANVLRDEVFVRIREVAEERGIPVAFLYLPSVAEFEGTEGPVQRRMRELTFEALDAAGVPWLDASPYFVGDPAHSERFFFPSDRHPNAGGHAAMAAALRDLVRSMPLPKR